MPAISFQPEFLDALLSGSKQQTTRPVPPVPPKHPRFKVEDVLYVYNQQRKRISDKEVRQLSSSGVRMVRSKLCGTIDHVYPDPPEMIPDDLMVPHVYYAHFLGKVKVMQTYEILPCSMQVKDLEQWAHHDGFGNFATARCWFEIRYGARWMHQYWSVIRWCGWLERYFEPYEVIR